VVVGEAGLHRHLAAREVRL